MIYFFTPYSFEKKLFEAYDAYMNLVPGDNDWVCFLDGDTFFFENNFGHQIREYTERYPEAGMFTSYASRSSYSFMVPKDTRQESDSIKYHRDRSAEIYKSLHGQIKEINDHIAGHLMCLKKKTWKLIRPQLLKVLDGANLLGVDTQISNAIRSQGKKILLMRGIYLFHYYRFVEGKSYKKHLMDQTINVLIRTSNREQLFKRCLDSVRSQTYEDIKILVCADDDKTTKYVKKAGINPVVVQKRIKTDNETAPWNGYLNSLISQVKGGWILILDDDDYLTSIRTLEDLVKHLTDDNAIYFVRMKWPNARVIPSDRNFINQQIVRKDIGMPCFIFHAKHKHKLAFQPMKQGDYHFISKLATIIKKQKWINLIVTTIGNTGLNGKTEAEIN
jgi:hypothetical protein